MIITGNKKITDTDCQTRADDRKADHGKLCFKKRERIHHPDQKRRFIYHNRQLFSSLKQGCRLMGIKRSTFYDQKKVNMAKIQQETLLKEKIQQIAYEHPYYGYRTIA
jgi:hypothetical protein